MGVRGAAVATLCARCLECLIVVIYTFRIDKKIKMRLRDIFTKIDVTLLKDYFRKGFPVFFSGFIWGVAMSVQLAVLGHIGEDGLAVTANSISNTLFQIVTVVTYASASAAAVMISKAIGEGKRDLIKAYARTFQLMFVCIGIVTGALIFIFKDIILLAYSDLTPDARALALKFMTILSVTVVATSYQMPCHTGVVRGGGDTSFVFKVDSIFMWGIVLPASLVTAFVLHWPPEAVFFVLKCDQIVKCLVAFIKVNSFNWIKEVRDTEKGVKE
jgi:Na+-driven multidrug efflux pump